MGLGASWESHRWSWVGLRPSWWAPEAAGRASELTKRPRGGRNGAQKLMVPTLYLANGQMDRKTDGDIGVTRG